VAIEVGGRILLVLETGVNNKVDSDGTIDEDKAGSGDKPATPDDTVVLDGEVFACSEMVEEIAMLADGLYS
jgi:hypothetical protein